MSKKDLVNQAALKALSRPTKKPTPIGGKVSTKPVLTPASQKSAKTPKKETATKSSRPRQKSTIPEKGSSEATAHKLAADAASIRLSEPEPALPQKGGAEAAVHNLASNAAAEKDGTDPAKSSAHKNQGSGLGFLFLVLALPLAIVAGLYAYATQTGKGGQGALTTAKSQKARSEGGTGRMASQGLQNPLMNKSAKDRTTPAMTAPKTAVPNVTSKTAKPTKEPKEALANHNPHWDYKSTDWAALSPSYKMCGEGRSQSPINIQASNNQASNNQAGPRFQFNYGPASGKIHNNGHGLQVDLIKGARNQRNQLLVNGKAYDLVQFHFHTPSENHINGLSFPMEVHLVHKNAQNQLAVVAVMIGAGAPNQLIDQMPTPAKKGEFANSGGPYINPAALLPHDRRSYTFSGSLTTPPCTQNVGWIVLKTPISISSAALQKFQKVLGKNNRPLQPTNGRVIFRAN